MKSGKSKAGKKSHGFFVYLARCSDGTYYCGYSRDVEKRIEVHNLGRGAKYTRARKPIELVYFEKKKTILQAMRRELEIKALSRRQKEGLILKGSPKDRPA
jgi:putative endonuclease